MAETSVDKFDVSSLPHPKPHRVLRRTTAAVAVIIAAVYAISIYVGWQLTHPARRAIDASPVTVGLQYEDIEFISRRDELRLRGWLIKGQGNWQTVIFAHGYGRNRLQNDVPLLPIVQALVKRGVNVVMFDFRNSGESAGNQTSVGQYEADDLLGAVDYIRSRPDIKQKITLFGFSMGAATAIMAGAREPSVAAVIADSPFADLDSYLIDNLSVRSGLPKLPFNHTISSVIPMVTGLQPESVSPLKEVRNLAGRPLLLIHGDADNDIPILDSIRLKAASSNAQLIRIAGADHVGSFAVARERYLLEVLYFLEKVGDRR